MKKRKRKKTSKIKEKIIEMFFKNLTPLTFFYRSTLSIFMAARRRKCIRLISIFAMRNKRAATEFIKSWKVYHSILASFYACKCLANFSLKDPRQFCLIFLLLFGKVKTYDVNCAKKKVFWRLKCHFTKWSVPS